MIKPIYEPKGRAKEYGELAINIYTGCNHGCTYCYAPRVLRKTPEEFQNVKPRENIVEATKKQLSGGKYKGKKIMLCFTCDPYPAEIDTTPTREIIQAIKDAGAHVQILTKGGYRAKRDFDLLDKNDSFGVTITGYSDWTDENEPNTGDILERMDTLERAHNVYGIKTWISYEPVFFPQIVYNGIRCNFIDFYKFGKLNYAPSEIDWGEFGRECERLCKECGRDYYIKEDLRALM